MLTEEKKQDSFVEVAQLNKQRHLAQARKPKGMNLYEYNPENGQVNEVVYTHSIAQMPDLSISDKASAKSVAVVHKVQVKRGCKYVFAINKANAERKFARGIKK